MKVAALIREAGTVADMLSAFPDDGAPDNAARNYFASMLVQHAAAFGLVTGTHEAVADLERRLRSAKPDSEELARLTLLACCVRDAGKWIEHAMRAPRGSATSLDDALMGAVLAKRRASTTSR